MSQRLIKTRLCVAKTLKRDIHGRFLQRRQYHELSYASPGEPKDVLKYKRNSAIIDDIPPSAMSLTGLVKVDMLHAPWNPADINTIQGKYPSPYDPSGNDLVSIYKSRYFDNDSVPGSEGWGRVVVSSSLNTSESIPVGSLVTISNPGLGTLRSSLWIPETALLRIPEALLEEAGPSGCTLLQLGGTALRMLSDFVSLQSGDVVLQNAGNSGVGFMASQLASTLFGASVVSLVRRESSQSPEEFDNLVQYLKRDGMNKLVVAEEDLHDRESIQKIQSKLRELSSDGELPKLALNSVGGDSAKTLLKLIGNGGTLVTYGGMSRKPVVVATSQVLFKDIRVVGYWHSRWMTRQKSSSKQEMLDTLASSVLDSKVRCPPSQVFPLHNIHDALQWQSNEGGIRKKLILDCQEEDI